MFAQDPMLVDGGRARALNEWRMSAQLVSDRWALFLEAEPEARAWTFASYVAALDAEEAAATAMSGVAARAAA